MNWEHQPESVIRDRYRVIDILGRGSSGITYRVEDLNTKQEVALKALSLHRLKDWKQIELFEREAEVLAKLNHPAIPKYLDYFQVDTRDNRAFYIAQALAPGKSLSAWVESGWRTKEREVKDIARQVLSVLDYLHSLDPPAIHRDIKPENIILSKDGKIYLVDFGAVQNTYHNTLMQGSTVVGTYGYMAPEQFRGKAVPATDLYSLGATLLYLLTHKSPAELPQDTLKLDFRASVNTSEEFTDWLDKILEPSLEYRYISAREALIKLNGKQKVKNRDWLEIDSEGIAVFIAAVPILSLALTVFLIADYGRISEVLSYSPHWKVLSKLKYHPLNVCHSYSGMNHYIRSGGITDIAVASISGDSKKLSECTFASEDNINLYNQAVFNNAARENDLETVEIFIKKGIDVNFQERKKYFTALHWAVYNHNFLMTKLLVNRGADINIVASHPFYSATYSSDFPYGVTAVSLAIEQKNYSAAELFVLSNYKINLNNRILSKVKSAVQNNNIHFLRLMLSNDKLVKSLRKKKFYDYEDGYISLLDLSHKYSNSLTIDLIEEKINQ